MLCVFVPFFNYVPVSLPPCQQPPADPSLFYTKQTLSLLHSNKQKALNCFYFSMCFSKRTVPLIFLTQVEHLVNREFGGERENARGQGQRDVGKAGKDTERGNVEQWEKKGLK